MPPSARRDVCRSLACIAILAILIGCDSAISFADHSGNAFPTGGRLSGLVDWATPGDIALASPIRQVSSDDDHHGHDHEDSNHTDDGFGHYDDHGHGHDDHPEFDHLEHGTIHRHETEEGYPYIHLLKTEHAFLDPKTQVAYADSDGVDGGLVDEHELEIEYFHVFSSRLGFILEVPVIARDPSFERSTAGIGDLEFGLQWVGFNGHYDILSFGLNVAVPTGDPDRELGSGHTTLEAVTYYWHDFSCGLVYQGEFKLELPVSVEEVENEFVYNMGISKTFLSTRDWRAFRWLSPLVELNGVTALNGIDAGTTVVNVTPGLR